MKSRKLHHNEKMITDGMKQRMIFMKRWLTVMKSSVHLSDWKDEGARIRLYYEDGESFCVSREDFNRAFACFLNADKTAIKRDFT